MYIGIPISHEYRDPRTWTKQCPRSMGWTVYVPTNSSHKNQRKPRIGKYTIHPWIHPGYWSVSQELLCVPSNIMWNKGFTKALLKDKPPLLRPDLVFIDTKAIFGDHCRCSQVACEVPLSSVSTMLSAALLQHLGALGSRGVVEHRDYTWWWCHKGIRLSSWALITTDKQ